MKRSIVLGGLALTALVGGILFHVYGRSVPGALAPTLAAVAEPTYVGATSCAGCHAEQTAAWKGSHHDLAMQHATAQSVLGDFRNARFDYHGTVSTFTSHDGKFFVRTDGADGKLADFEIRYTFGVAPLQQYLVQFPDGRLQALSIAWDSRSRDEGGQRWFHLYPNDRIDSKDELHWLRVSQNWNYMCAECHSTNVKKGYDAAANSFNTTWSEINVGCESCHGPASAHVAWASQVPRAEGTGNMGLALRLNERQDITWAWADGARTATRSQPRTTTRELDTCARCHSRRSALSEDYRHGQPFMDTHLPALLTPPLYHPDGQIRDEVFEQGSFMQSRMHQQGVMCGDCHEPHNLKLRQPGNQTCLQCHKAEVFNTGKHHHHPANSKGAQCAECHMPTTNFMVVHARHDHSIRIPRPDLSARLHTPNACNNCHKNQNAAWAVARMNQWYGTSWSADWHYGETMFDAQEGKLQNGQNLMAIAVSPQLSEIVRASAAALLQNYPDPGFVVGLPPLLTDKSPMIRHAALSAVEAMPPADRLRIAGKLLVDPVLAVRMEAARIFSSLPRDSFTAAQAQQLDSSLREYIQAELATAEHPQSNVNLGLLYLGMGQPDEAEKYYLRAIQLEPTYTIAHINLADLYRERGQDTKTEATLTAARSVAGNQAAVEHALGLHYVRVKQMTRAVQGLAQAVKLDPENARYRYVYAVALNSSGDRARALTELQTIHSRQPNDRDVLVGLIAFNREKGDIAAATKYARELSVLDPRYGTVQQLMQ